MEALCNLPLALWSFDGLLGVSQTQCKRMLKNWHQRENRWAITSKCNPNVILWLRWDRHGTTESEASNAKALLQPSVTPLYWSFGYLIIANDIILRRLCWMTQQCSFIERLSSLIGLANTPTRWFSQLNGLLAQKSIIKPILLLLYHFPSSRLDWSAVLLLVVVYDCVACDRPAGLRLAGSQESIVPDSVTLNHFYISNHYI